MLLSIGRAATRQVASTTLATSFARPLVLRSITRSPYEALGLYRRNRCAARAYANAARAKTTAAPKKSTRSAPAKKPAKKTTKATTTKAKAKAKAKPKPKAKSKAKPKTKPKATTKARGRPRRPMSDERKIMLERQALKRTALFSDPKLLAIRTWPLYVAEQTRGKAATDIPVINQITGLSQQYKELSPSEMQRLQSVVEQNKLKNAATYKSWVESHTPQEIYDANLARRTLKRKFNYPKGNVRHITDERLPKAPPTSYALFTKVRWASGELAGLSTPEAAARVGKEWKGLSAAERQRYTDTSQTERASYEKKRDTLITTRTTSRNSSPK